MPGIPTLQADVLVCGAGVAGTMAAVAAARQGAHVVLLERYGFLGGNATAGAVAQFNSWQTAGGRRVVAGLAQEVVARLRHYGAAGAHEVFVMSTGHRMDRVRYAPEVLKLVLDDMVTQAGVQPLLHAVLLDVVRSGERIDTVHILTRSAVQTIRPKVVVDAGGDMDAMVKSGAQCLTLDADESLQPATMMFRFGPVDFARFDALPAAEVAVLAQRGYAQGALPRAALHVARDPYTADGWFNISRIAVDASDAWALARAEIEGRKQAWRAAQFLRQHVPGCAAGNLLAFGTQLGIRETRRVRGDYVLTAQDLLAPTLFDDAIAAGAYPIDIHPATGGALEYAALQDDHAYQIPYRSLCPIGLANALVAGRGISATHRALAAIRVMTISMAVGQAAGIAAAMAAEHDGAIRTVAIAQLQTALRQAGACLA